MEEMVIIFLCGIVMFVVTFFIHVYVEKHENKEIIIIEKDGSVYNSEKVQAFINERWTIQADIREAVIQNQYPALKERINQLAQKYKNQIPDSVLEENITSLNIYYHVRFSQLAN